MTYPATDRRANNLALPRPQLAFSFYLFCFAQVKKRRDFQSSSSYTESPTAGAAAMCTMGPAWPPSPGWSLSPSTTGWGFWVSKYTEPGDFGLGQSSISFVKWSSLPSTTDWRFCVSKYTEPGGFGLGKSSWSSLPSTTGWGFWVSNYSEPGGFGLGQCSLPVVKWSSIPSTTCWRFWVSNYSEPGGFGLGCSLLFVKWSSLPSTTGWGFLGKQSNRVRQFWVGSKIAIYHQSGRRYHQLYIPGVLGKQLHTAWRFWDESKFATFLRVVVVTINYRLGVLGKQLHKPAVLVWVEVCYLL